MATKQPTFFDTDVSVEVPMGVANKAKETGKEKKEIGFEPPSTLSDEEIEIIPFSMEKPRKAVADAPANEEDDDDDNQDPDEGNDDGKKKEDISDDTSDDDDGNDAPPDSSSSSPYLAFAKVLYEGGALTQLNEQSFLEIAEKQGDTAALIEMVKQTVDDVVQGQLNKLPKDYRDLMEAASKGVPLRDALKTKTDIQTYSSIKDKDVETDEALAEKLMRESYSIRGFSKDETDEAIQDAKDVDKLTIKALSALKHLNKHSKERETQLEKEAEDQKVNAEVQRLENMRAIKSTIANIDKLIPGVTVSKLEQDKLFDMLTTPVKQDPESGVYLNKVWAKRAENTTQFDTTLAYLINKGIFDGKMDSLVRTAKSKAIKELDAVLKSGVGLSGGTPIRRQAAIKKGDAVKALDMFKRKPDY